MSGKAPSEKKRKKKKVLPKGPDADDVHTMAFAMLNNKVDGLQNMLANAMAQIQKLEQRMNENWSKFFFHDHRRIDAAGPQFYNTDFERSYIQEQERQKAAQAPPPPSAAPPKKAEQKSDKK
jgi:hypothetical protein